MKSNSLAEMIMDSRVDILTSCGMTKEDAVKRVHTQAETLDADRLADVIENLPEREKLVMKSRFMDGMSYSSIGEKIGVCYNRVAQIVADTVRKLSGQMYWKQFVSNCDDDAMEMTVAELGFCDGICNLLRKAGLFTLSDISKADPKELAKVRHIGTKVVKEIVERAEMFGVVLEDVA
jgi:hypothetical protein